MPTYISKSSACQLDTKTSAKKRETCKYIDTHKLDRMLLPGKYSIDFYAKKHHYTSTVNTRRKLTFLKHQSLQKEQLPLRHAMRD